MDGRLVGRLVGVLGVDGLAVGGCGLLELALLVEQRAEVDRRAGGRVGVLGVDGLVVGAAACANWPVSWSRRPTLCIARSAAVAVPDVNLQAPSWRRWRSLLPALP